MFEEQILETLMEEKVLITSEIRKRLSIPKEHYATLNTEIKRLCDKGRVKRGGKGVYITVWDTKWGKVIPTEQEIVHGLYISNDNGYQTGATFLNKLGISTLIPQVQEITTNQNTITCNCIQRVILNKPRTKINAQNKLYLQILDGICSLKRNHCDAPDALNIIADFIREKNINETKLVLYAKKYYPKTTLDVLLQIMEVLYHDELTHEI